MDNKLNPYKRRKKNKPRQGVLKFPRLRKITPQNKSFMMSVPHVFVHSCLDEDMKVRVEMKDGQLIVTPAENKERT